MEINGIEPPLGPQEVHDGSVLDDTRAQKTRKHFRKRHHFDLSERLKLKEDNPVGVLQSICTYHKWPTPVYQLIGECGVPHKRQYALCVSVNCYNSYGVGYSKKAAKKEAALKMCDLLIPINFEILTENRNIPVESNNPSQYFKNSTGVYFRQLYSFDYDNMCGDNCLELFTNLKKEQFIRSFFVESEEFSLKLGQSVIYLNLADRHMFMGKGNSLAEAKCSASRSALRFLHLIQKYDALQKKMALN